MKCLSFVLAIMISSCVFSQENDMFDQSRRAATFLDDLEENPNVDTKTSLNDCDCGGLRPALAHVTTLVSVPLNDYFEKAWSIEDSLLSVLGNILFIERNKTVPMDELLSMYYKRQRTKSRHQDIAYYSSFLFKVYSQRTEDFDFKNIHFNSRSLHMTSIEQEIFLLQFVYSFQKVSFYFLSHKNPDFDAAMEVFDRFPSFDGKKYFDLSEFQFEDFIVVYNGRELSFLRSTLDIYFQTLLYHTLALKEVGRKDEARLLLQTSVLNKPEYYSYYFDPDALTEIVKTLSIALIE